MFLHLILAGGAALLSLLAVSPMVFGGVTQASVRRTADMFVYDITATADADTTSTQAHGMGVIPDVWFTPILSQALTALSAWSFVADVTNVTGTKLASTGSGNAGAQVRVYVSRPR